MDNKKLFVMCYVYIFSRMNAQHCFAADAAGAARGLGAIFGVVACQRACRSVEVASGAAESWALGRSLNP